MADHWHALTPGEQDVVVGVGILVALVTLAAIVQALGVRRARHVALTGVRSQTVWSVLLPFAGIVALVVGWPWVAAAFGGAA